MKIFTHLLLTLLISSAFFEVCNGAVWFEGFDPQEPQENRLAMQYIQHPPEFTPSSPPFCYLTLNETEPHTVNLAITVSTMALFRQTENFVTWLSIDSKEAEKLIGEFNSSASAMGAAYTRQYNVTLSGLENGAHSVEIQVAGDFNNLNGVVDGNYECQSNATILVNDQPVTSPTPSVPEFPIQPILILFVIIPLMITITLKRKNG